MPRQPRFVAPRPTTCRVCARPLRQAARGRVREAHDVCGDLVARMTQVSRLLDAVVAGKVGRGEVVEALGPDTVRHLRGELWSMANTLNQAANAGKRAKRS